MLFLWIGNASALFLLYAFFLTSTSWYFCSGYKIILSVAGFFAIYWLLSIFIFLFKRASLTLWTNVIQRYWKRALYLFWILELFLFSIYIFLVLSSPSETEWLRDQVQLFNKISSLDSSFFFKLLVSLVLIYSMYLISLAVVYCSRALRDVQIIITTTILVCLARFDLYNLVFLGDFYHGFKWKFDIESSAWLLVGELSKMRTLEHYVFLMGLLKFWHVAFIVSFWLVALSFIAYQPHSPQGAYSANKQNFFFLYLFCLLPLYSFYKSYMNASYEQVYYWFWVNPLSVSNSFSSIYDACISLL